jgi:hypothetical protein
LESACDEVSDLRKTILRHDEIRPLVIEFQECALVLREPEEIILLFHRLDRHIRMVRTFPVIEIRIRLLEFAPDAVLRLVLFLIDIASRFAPPPKFLRGSNMMLVGRADEMRIAHVERFLDHAEVFRHPITVFLWCHTLFGGLLEDLLPMLVRADIEDRLVPARPSRARKHIRLHRLQSIAEMRSPVHVRQGCRYIKWLIFRSFIHRVLTKRYLWSII